MIDNIAVQFLLNQKLIVKEDAALHKGRIGYFQYPGEDVAEGLLVLSSTPTTDGNEAEATYFVVFEDDVKLTE